MRSKRSDQIASIDTGSNSIRLLIGFVDENGKVIRLRHERKITRLSDSLKDTGLLKKERMIESLNTISDFKILSLKEGCRRIITVGTHALRYAGNASEFLKMVKESADIDIRIISPVEEAQLTLTGILSGFEDIPYPSMIFDIGGGSTEFIVLLKEREPVRLSIPLGVVGLSEMLDNSSHTVGRVRNIIRENLINNLAPFRIPYSSLIGTGGTCTTVASIHLSIDSYEPERIHGYRLKNKDVMDIEKMILGMDVSERQSIKGLEKGREDIISGGIVFLGEIMDFFNMDELIISDYGILEGIIKQEAIIKNG